MDTPNTDNDASADPEVWQSLPLRCYTVAFRPGDHPCLASSQIRVLKAGEIVMSQTDHGLEPATISGYASPLLDAACEKKKPLSIVRRCTRTEIEKYEELIKQEDEAFGACQRLIEKHALPMKLVKVERFFSGSKIIFYFTAESRVDFRELVKDLVQEFRTRVEIRQIGVRHETKMLGGLGCCGRELCCSSYITNFAPVSIKMAKEQGLPLNPAKISGICNRLLCCLTYEFETYHSIRREMPKIGKTISLDGQDFRVLSNNILQETITVASADDPSQTRSLSRDEWSTAAPAGSGSAKVGGVSKGRKDKGRKTSTPQGEQQ